MNTICGQNAKFFKSKMVVPIVTNIFRGMMCQMRYPRDCE